MAADPPAVSGPAVSGPAANGHVPGARLSRVLEQRFDVHGLYQLRAAVAAYSADLGVPADLTHDIVIAVHELATNAIRHGAGQGQLRMWSSGQRLFCEVADGGLGVLPGPALPVSAPAGNDELPWRVEPGHGLWLVSQVAEHLTVHLDHQAVTVVTTFVITQ